MNKKVDQKNPTLGQIRDTYDDTAVYLSGALREHTNYTLGNVLTAIEASLGDNKQAEAFKSIVRREFYALMERNQAEIYVRAGMQHGGLEEKEIIEINDEDGKHEGYTARRVNGETADEMVAGTGKKPYIDNNIELVNE